MQPPSTPRKPRSTKPDPDKDDDALVKPLATGKAKTSTTRSTTRPAPKPSAKSTAPADSNAASSTPVAPPASTPSAAQQTAPAQPKMSPPPSKPVAPAGSSTSGASSAGGERITQLGRTLIKRNQEIVGRWGSSASGAIRKQVSKLTERASSVDVSKPLNKLAQDTGKLAQRSGSMIDEGTSKLQKQLETSDAAVLVTTMLIFAVCVVLTALVVVAALPR